MPAAFLPSLVLRASQGSATVAILTTSGLLSQAVAGLEPLQLVLVTLATCFGLTRIVTRQRCRIWGRHALSRTLGAGWTQNLDRLDNHHGGDGLPHTAAVVYCDVYLGAPATLLGPGTGPDPLPLSDRRAAADSVTGIK